MPSLVELESGSQLTLAPGQRLHWILGRSKDCDLVFSDAGISRYHCTLFHFKNGFYLLDHSFNGTHLVYPANSDGPEQTVHFKSSIPTPKSPPPPPPSVSHSQLNDTSLIPVEDLVPESGEGWKDYVEDLNKSHAAFRMAQTRTAMPKVIGYEAHQYKVPDSLQPMLQMIYSSDDAENLAAMGRPVYPGMQILLIGEQRHAMRFSTE